jgi:hypothetical protein
MPKPSKVRVKLARFVEQRKVCPDCLEEADKIVMRGDVVGYWKTVTVSGQLQRDCHHERCETWVRLSLWLLGDLDVNDVPWVDLHAYVRSNMYMHPNEKMWDGVFLLMEEELENMTRTLCLEYQWGMRGWHGWVNEWNEVWR